MHFDLRRLDHFLAVVKHGSINRAAQELNISQAATTKSIQMLEGQLRGMLFERGPRGSTLTRLGQTFLRHARLIENQRNRAVAAVEAHNKGVAGELRIGVSMRWVMRLVMPDILIRFAAEPQSPRITIVSGVPSWKMIENLANGDLDVVLGTPTEADDLTGVDVRHFLRDPQRIVVRKGHPLTQKARIELVDLDRYEWLRGPRENYFGRFLEGQYLTQGRVLPEPRLSIDENALALDVISRTDLIGVATRLMVSVEHADRIAMLETPGDLDRATAIMTRTGDVLPKTAHDVIDEIGAALKKVLS